MDGWLKHCSKHRGVVSDHNGESARGCEVLRSSYDGVDGANHKYLGTWLNSAQRRAEMER